MYNIVSGEDRSAESKFLTSFFSAYSFTLRNVLDCFVVPFFREIFAVTQGAPPCDRERKARASNASVHVSSVTKPWPLKCGLRRETQRTLRFDSDCSGRSSPANPCERMPSRERLFVEVVEVAHHNRTDLNPQTLSSYFAPDLEGGAKPQHDERSDNDTHPMWPSSSRMAKSYAFLHQKSMSGSIQSCNL